MKQKCVWMGIGVLIAALLSGCGDESEPIEKRREGSAVIEEPIVTEVPIVQEASQIVKKENREYQMQAINLTEQNELEVCIDYSIAGHDVLQKFSHELFTYNMAENNPVLSPISAYLALSLAGVGAEGETGEEFQRVLGDLKCIPYDLMMNLPREQEGMQISLANSAWVDEKLTPNEDWLAWADSVYRSEVYQTKLSTETAMEDMNQWIERNTNGLIPKLLEQPLESDARLALFNTIYFKGDWKNVFHEENTEELEFTLTDGTIEQVEMMQLLEENLQYIRNNVAEGVILPYQDANMAFVALKPVGDINVRKMYEELSIGEISELLQQAGTTLCNLRLPKFEIEFDKLLNDSLKAMGLELAFVDGEADFSGLGTTDSGLGLYISQVRQKAKIVVDEVGTEAAAVTAIVMIECTSVMEPKLPINVYFDEPFLYMIMDMEREVPLFIGIMDNPNA